jgi:hypothetical protein
MGTVQPTRSVNLVESMKSLLEAKQVPGSTLPGTAIINYRRSKRHQAVFLTLNLFRFAYMVMIN